jgi:tRNA dimethylallyltransferase
MNRLLVICGPTATGKTRLALLLAKEFNGEVLSADSRQVYKGMDIGTGKDVKHIALYDLINPDQEFSVSHYARLAHKVIKDIHKKEKLPIVVGGTGLYIKAITEGIETIDIPRDDSLRKALEHNSIEELQKKLPLEILNTMNHSDKHNPRRLIRKIEIVSSSSKTLQKYSPAYHVLSIGVMMKHDTLKKKIRERVLQRLDQGIIEEITRLLRKGYSWDLPSMNTFGYKEWKQYIEHPAEENKTIAIENWIDHEIEYARKQMVWFKKQKNICWFDMGRPDALEQIRETVRLWYN